MRVTTVTVPAASGLLISGSGYITYWSVLDTSVSGGSQFALYDGSDDSGNALVTVSTNSGESTSEYIHRAHLFYTSSLYYNLVSGSIAGSVTVHACDSAEELQRLVSALSTLQDIAGQGP